MDVEVGNGYKVAATLDPATHYLGHGKDTLTFVLALDAINFGSGYFPEVRKRPGHSGYFTMAAGLNDWFQAEGAPDAARLARLTQADRARIFGQDLGKPAAAELMGLFAKALNDLGALLLARFGGDAARLVESAEHKAEKLVAILRIMPFFDDVEIWHGRKVPFMKRAQLTAADLGLAFEQDGWGRFDDLDRLTIFADNLVPHVLRVDGVLDYDPDLAAQIERSAAADPSSHYDLAVVFVLHPNPAARGPVEGLLGQLDDHRRLAGADHLPQRVGIDRALDERDVDRLVPDVAQAHDRVGLDRTALQERVVECCAVRHERGHAAARRAIHPN